MLSGKRRKLCTNENCDEAAVDIAEEIKSIRDGLEELQA